MPAYDWHCAGGHTFEASVDRTVHATPCLECDLSAQRQFAVPAVTGIVQVPMRERKIPLNRMIEAHDTIVHEAEKAHVEPPNTLKIAKAAAREIQAKAPELLGA